MLHTRDFLVRHGTHATGMRRRFNGRGLLATCEVAVRGSDPVVWASMSIPLQIVPGVIG